MPSSLECTSQVDVTWFLSLFCTFASQTAHYIRVTQTGSAGNYWSIYEFNVYAVPPAPSAPTGLAAKTASSSQVNLVWNPSSSANSYNIKRSPVSGGNYVTVAGYVIGTNYSDTGLAASTTYYYVTSVIGSGGESTNSPPTMATTQPSTTPTGIVMAISGNTLTLSWPADHLGWHLQVQTNSVGGGLATNWFTLVGSELVTRTNITVAPANASVFYRLVYP